MKDLIVFDLDGTLAQSKAPIDREMAALLGRLLCIVKVAVISGGDWPQFQTQVVDRLAPDARFPRLSLLPTCGTKFFSYDHGWTKRYSEDFSAAEKERIIGALQQALTEADFKLAQVWGNSIEDRGSQITLSVLGQQAPLPQKQLWDPTMVKRKRLKELLDQSLPGYSVRLGGATSVDVTKPGIDKAYGINKLQEILGINKDAMLFIGDALFPGGNDYAVKAAGVDSISVQDPQETKRIVETLIACLQDAVLSKPHEAARA